MTDNPNSHFEASILHVAISNQPENGSIEVSPNITAELNEKGELIGIEILNASTFIRDSILEPMQKKMLQFFCIQIDFFILIFGSNHSSIFLNKFQLHAFFSNISHH